MLHDGIVVKIAGRLNVSSALVVLNYGKNHLNQVVIPRSSNVERMKENLLKIDSFELIEEDVANLRSLDGKLPQGF